MGGDLHFEAVCCNTLKSSLRFCAHYDMILGGECVFQLRRLLHTLNRPTDNSLLVHCLSGIGRSATLIAVDIAVSLIENDFEVCCHSFINFTVTLLCTFLELQNVTNPARNLQRNMTDEFTMSLLRLCWLTTNFERLNKLY